MALFRSVQEGVCEASAGSSFARGYFKLDLRLGYTIRLRDRTLELFGDIFNVTNRANFATPSGNSQSSNLAAFLNLTDTLQGNSNPRLLQVGVRFAF